MIESWHVCGKNVVYKYLYFDIYLEIYAGRMHFFFEKIKIKIKKRRVWILLRLLVVFFRRNNFIVLLRILFAWLAFVMLTIILALKCQRKLENYLAWVIGVGGLSTLESALKDWQMLNTYSNNANLFNPKYCCICVNMFKFRLWPFACNILVLLRFKEKHNRAPQAGSTTADAAELVKLRDTVLDELKMDRQLVPDNFAR